MSESEMVPVVTLAQAAELFEAERADPNFGSRLSRSALPMAQDGIPDFFYVTERGVVALRVLRRRDFPTTKAGEMAYCGYVIEKYTIRRDALAVKRTRQEILADRVAAAEAALEALKTRLAGGTA